jgi:LPPG:FO 2-phospho-L-lactate transferase
MNARFNKEVDLAAPRKVIALSGGIGGAKLALGLKQVLPGGALTVIANTGDDFVHMGLHVSPDIDTLVYTLTGLNNAQAGWGRAGETWSFMAAVEALGGEAWFKLGDGDLAMHVLRTARLAGGEPLSAVTAEVCRALDVGATIVPMSDQPVRTMLRSDEGWLEFQDYFVRRQAAPVVHEIIYEGAAEAAPPPGLCELIAGDDVDAIVICPSNPLISVEPILAVPGIRGALATACAPVVAVSPIIAGRAVKGPTAKMLHELGFAADAATVMQRYAGLIDAFIADTSDIAALEALGSDVVLAGEDIMMTTLADRERVARCVFEVAGKARARKGTADRFSGVA